MKQNILPAVKLTTLCMIFFGVVYTAIVWSIAQFSPNQGKGEIITYSTKNKKAFGFENVGQRFTNDNYFYSRPSAVEYNAAGSGGSNKGPSNAEYLIQVQARIDTFLVHNPGILKSDIPSDLVTASGSGLDPNISVQAAKVQIKRIAKIRNIAEGNIQQLIISSTEAPLFGLFGTEKINVLKLNIALDNLSKTK